MPLLSRSPRSALVLCVHGYNGYLICLALDTLMVLLGPRRSELQCDGNDYYLGWPGKECKARDLIFNFCYC